MKELLEFFKNLFAGDDEKVKKIDEYTKKLKDEKPDEKPKGKPNDNQDFDLDKLLLKLDGKTLENSDNKQLLAIIAKLKEGQDALLNEMAETKKKEEERNKILAEKAKQENEKKINDLLELAKRDGRIPPKDEVKINSFKKLLESDFESAKTALEALPKTNNKNPVKQEDNSEAKKVPNAFGFVGDGFLAKVQNDLKNKA